ncbi:MAG: CPBP family intramembrane metalloprotease [Proteobacteria bacterium]|nr:CPBP family intramembrane metalloprotease [Pseudomonadota bacterium]
MRRALCCYVICFALIGLNILASSWGTPINDITWFLAVFGLIGVPIAEVRWVHPRDEKDAGIVIEWSWKDLGMGVAAVALLLVPVALGNHFLRTAILGMDLQFSLGNYARLETPLYWELPLQILCVALPEEFFYRGYLQTAFLKHLSDRKARFAPALAIVLASICFALVHLPSGGPARLLTFFPGLLFGFLRYRSGGLLGAIFCHAMCNMMMVVLNVHYI